MATIFLQSTIKEVSHCLFLISVKHILLCADLQILTPKSAQKMPQKSTDAIQVCLWISATDLSYNNRPS